MQSPKRHWLTHPRRPRIRLRTIINNLNHPLFVMLQHWINTRHPIFRQVIKQPIPMPSLENIGIDTPTTRRIAYFAAKWGGAPIGCILMPIFILLPFFPWLWRIPTIISTGPLIAHEVERRTWFTLRSTPYNTKEIIQALHAGGTYRIAAVWAYVTIVRTAVVGLFIIIIFILSWTPSRDGLSLAPVEWAAYLLCALYFIFEPLLDTAIDGMVALLGSTIGQTQLSSIINAMLLRITLWGIQIISLIFILPIASMNNLSPHLTGNIPNLVFFGPAHGPALGFSPEASIVMIVCLSAFRLIWLSILTELTARRAATI